MFLDTRRRGCCQVVYCKKNTQSVSAFSLIKFSQVRVSTDNPAKDSDLEILFLFSLTLFIHQIFKETINNEALFTMTDISCTDKDHDGLTLHSSYRLA